MVPRIPHQPSVPDAELLRRYVETHDDTAFELLVWRYGRLVYSTTRRLLPQSADAEDATQATFLILARRAHAVRGNVGGWLYRVAVRCAMRLRASQPRTVPPLEHELTSERDLSESRELSHILDAELSQLPEKYRLPLVLCYLHGLTYPEAAAQLGCPLGTLSGWLNRGKAMLRDRLTARGLSLSIATLTTAMSAITACELIPNYGHFAATALQHATTPSRAATLAQGVSTMMMLKSWLTTAAAVAVVLGGLLAAMVVAIDDPPKPNEKPKAEAKRVVVKSDHDRFQGEWIFSSAIMPDRRNGIRHVWNSRLVISGNTITLTNYLVPGSEVDVPVMKSTFSYKDTIEPKMIPHKQIDLEVPKWLETVFGPTILGGAIRGIYKFEDDDTLTMCLAERPRFARPTQFDRPNGGGFNPLAILADSKNTDFQFTVKRLKTPVPELPSEVTVRVVDENGAPMRNTQVTSWGHHHNFIDTAWKWNYTPGYRTNEQGEFLVKSKELTDGTTYARTSEPVRYGVLDDLSPYRLVTEKPLVLTVHSPCKIRGKLTCEPLAKRGFTVGWTNVYIGPKNGGSLSSYASENGEYELYAPPGRYQLSAYGENLEMRHSTILVKPGQTEHVEDLELTRNTFGKLLGEPAPELKQVVAWKGEPVTLADLKGKPILLLFWHYDKHVAAHPIDHLAMLHTLHKDYAARGLEIVLVAIDLEAKVNNTEAFLKKANATRAANDALSFPFRVAMINVDHQNGNNQSLRDYGVDRLQLPVFINRAGTVMPRPRWTMDAIKERIVAMLK